MNVNILRQHSNYIIREEASMTIDNTGDQCEYSAINASKLKLIAKEFLNA